MSSEKSQSSYDAITDKLANLSSGGKEKTEKPPVDPPREDLGAKGSEGEAKEQRDESEYHID